MRRLMAYIKADLFREFILTFGAQVMGSGMGFILQIALQKVLGPGLYGILRTATSVGIITTLTTDLGVSHAMIRFTSKFVPDDMPKAFARIVAALIIRVVLTLLTTLVGYLLVDWLAVGVYDTPELAEPLRWVFLGLIGGTLFGYYMYFTQALQRFGLRSMVTVSTAVIRVGLFAILWWLGMLGPTEMIMLDATVNILGFGIGMYFAPKGMKEVKAAEVKHAAFQEIIPFCKYTGILLLANGLFNQLDTLMLAKFTDERVVGVYGSAWNYAMVLNFVTMSVSNVIFPKITSIEKVSELRAFVSRTIKFTVPLAIATLPALPFMSWWLPWFQPEYADALPVFYVMYVGLVFELVIGPLDFIHYSLNRPDILVKIALVKIALNFGANYFFIPMYGATGAAVATVVTRMLGGVVSVIVLLTIIRRRQAAEDDRGPTPAPEGELEAHSEATSEEDSPKRD